MQIIQHYPGYEVPHILDAAVSLFMEYIQNGMRLYTKNPQTWTRCQEKYNAFSQLAVGGFAVGRLTIPYFRSDIALENDGIGGCRRLIYI